jgi:ABC-type amino acid transport system permease subunit
MTFRLDVIWKEWLQFALGLGNTVWLCAVSMLLGVLFVVPLMSRRRSVRGVARTVVDSGRCIPSCSSPTSCTTRSPRSASASTSGRPP